MPAYPIHLYADADPSPPPPPDCYQFRLTACRNRVLATSVITQANELPRVDCVSCRRTPEYRRIAAAQRSATTAVPPHQRG